MTMYNNLDHVGLNSFDDLCGILKKHKCQKALVKKLSKNHNDKNQLYFYSDISFLMSLFDLQFSEREKSTSITKRASSPGKAIPQAVFDQFAWIDTDHNLHKVAACKLIIYAQYPEVRMSGFEADDGMMPRSMSIDFVKQYSDIPRYLIVGATRDKAAVAIMLANPSPELCEQLDHSALLPSSKVLRMFLISGVAVLPSSKVSSSGVVVTPFDQLRKLLRNNVLGKTLPGCRFDTAGNRLPFSGTQVHGYTLEHACGIKPNSDSNGDIFGIELKCYTNKKLTLFTPEPDGGLYAGDYRSFMIRYGHLTDKQEYYFTGLHRCGQKCEKTGLTLGIYCLRKFADDEFRRVRFDPTISLTKQVQGFEIVLENTDGEIAASWSFERLMNCWKIKHNEVVYVGALVTDNQNPTLLEQGFSKQVTFDDFVLWCRNTSAERLVHALHAGTVYLDPGSKLNTSDSSKTKRRSQWRLNNIIKDRNALYELSEITDCQ